jgi:NitT/TauT family transport system permease protein
MSATNLGLSAPEGLFRLPRRNWSYWLADGVTLALFLGWAWRAHGLSEMVLPGPVAVLERLGQLFLDPDFLVQTVASTARILSAVALSLVIGGGLALLQRAVPVLDWAIGAAILPFLNSFPSIGWAILAAIWFPPSTFSILFVQVAILVPFCLINIAEGLRQLDPELTEMGHSFGRHRFRLLSLLTAPLLMPYVLGALRIAYGIGWKIALVAELLGSSSGLGYLMLQAQGAADMTTVLAACFCVVILFVAGEKLVLDPLARRYAPR